MASKFTIAELDINLDALTAKQAEYLAQITAIKESQKSLRTETDNLKNANEGQLTTYAKTDAELKNVNKQYNTNKAVLAEATTGVKSLTDALQKEARTESEAKKNNQQLVKLRSQVNVKTKEGAKAVDQINQKIDKNNKFIKQNSSALEKQRLNVGNYSSALDKLVPGLGGMVSGIGAATKASLAFIATPLGAVIAALVFVIGSLKAAFTASEEGQNKWMIVMDAIGVIVGNLVDVLAVFGEKIIAAFENPKESWEGLVESLKAGWEFIKGQVIDRFTAAFNILVGAFEIGILKMRIAWNDFTDDSEEADKLRKELEEVNKKVTESAAIIQKRNDEIVNGVKAVVQAVANEADEFIKHNQRELAIALQVSKAKAKLEMDERKLIVDSAKLGARIAELRLKSREEDQFSAAERKAALIEARELGDQLAAKEEANAAAKLKIIQTENTFSKTNIENKRKEAEAEAALYRVQEARANFNRQIQRDLIRVSGQEVAEINKIKKAHEEARKAQIEAEKEFQDLRSKAKSTVFEEELLRLEEEGASRLALVLLELSEEQRLEKEALQRKIENGEAFNRDLAVLEKRHAKERVRIKQEEEMAKLAIMADVFGQVAAFLGENSLLGKAAAIAQATINTYQGATLALATIPPPFGQIAAGVTILSGLRSVQKIASTPTTRIFEKGGLQEVGGKRHSAGGTKFVGSDGTTFEAEKGELIGVLNRNASKAFMDFNNRGLDGTFPMINTGMRFNDRGIISAIEKNKSKTNINVVVEDGMKWRMYNAQKYLS
jgi:hypothetical protein